jgi:hypothetical protein
MIQGATRTLGVVFAVGTASVSLVPIQLPVTREIDRGRLETAFQGHAFLSSYHVYETTDGRRRVNWGHEIRNVSNFEAKRLRWNSCGISIPGISIGSTSPPERNDIEFNAELQLAPFEASREIGLPSAEVERAKLPSGDILKYITDSAPCYLPNARAVERRFREAYPPYRWLTEAFEKNPLEIAQRFASGVMSINLLTKVSFKKGNSFLYEYEVRTDSPRALHFLWMSTASESIGFPDGLTGTVSKETRFAKAVTLDSASGPQFVLDVMLVNSESGKLLPVGRLEALGGWLRLYPRLAGAMTRHQDRIGVKDWSQEDMAETLVFSSLSLVPLEK